MTHCERETEASATRQGAPCAARSADLCCSKGGRSASRIGCDGGFTLTELLVVVIIVGLLAAIAIPSFARQRDLVEESQQRFEERSATIEASGVAREVLVANGVDADVDVLTLLEATYQASFETFEVSPEVTYSIIDEIPVVRGEHFCHAFEQEGHGFRHVPCPSEGRDEVRLQRDRNLNLTRGD